MILRFIFSKVEKGIKNVYTVHMETKKKLTSSNSFLFLIEKRSGKKPSEMYGALNWPRQKYHQQRARGGCPKKHRKKIFIASGLNKEMFDIAWVTFFSKFKYGAVGRPRKAD